MKMVSYFMQQPFASRQHILPSRVEIVGVPRVGYIAGLLGVVHQEMQLFGKIAAADAVHITKVGLIHTPISRSYFA